jgi:hypothetical protein
VVRSVRTPRSGIETTHDTIMVDKRANGRLCALLHIRSYILLLIAAINVGPEFVLKPGSGRRCAL